MDDATLINSLKNAIEQLYKNDSYLLQSDHELHEQTVSHRLAVYLEKNLRKSPTFRKNDFSIDCEYNKNGQEPKNIFSSCYNCSEVCFITSLGHNAFEKIKSARPDIIVHQRGNNRPTNLLILELKKESNSQNNEKEKDKIKLSAFTCRKDESPYQYQLGFFIEYNDKEMVLQEFKDGNETTICHFNAETKKWMN